MRSQPRDPASLCRALLDQLAYLIDEIEAQKERPGQLPAPLLEGRPFEGEQSIKEMYGLLAAADAHVHLPHLQQIGAEDHPTLAVPDRGALLALAAWNAHPLDALLQQIQTGRQALLDYLDALTPEAWTRTGTLAGTPHDVYAYAHAIVQNDTDALRTIALRLHDSQLTLRER